MSIIYSLIIFYIIQLGFKYFRRHSFYYSHKQHLVAHFYAINLYITYKNLKIGFLLLNISLMNILNYT